MQYVAVTNRESTGKIHSLMQVEQSKKDTHFDIITEDTGQLQYGGQQENCYGVRHTSKVTYFLFGTLIFSC